MTGRDRDDVAWPALALRAVVHEHLHPAGHDVTQVRDLTRVRARDRLHVGRPAPAGLECAAPDGMPADLDDVRTPVAFELTDLVRRVEALDLHRCHVSSSVWGVCRCAQANRFDPPTVPDKL